jgi:hypothetical protein
LKLIPLFAIPALVCFSCTPAPPQPGPDPIPDAGVDPDDPSGLYRLVALTIDEEGAEQTFTSTSDPGVVANAELSVEEDDVRLTIRTFDLDTGLPTEAPGEDDVVFLRQDATTWVVEDAAGDIPYAVTIEGDTLLLERQVSPADGPVALLLQADPPAPVAGEWTARSMVFDDREVDFTLCEAATEGSRSTEVLFSVDDALHAAELRIIDREFTDAACTDLARTDETHFSGIVQLDGDEMTLWAFELDDADPQALATTHAFEEVDGELRLEMTGCVPEPDCRAEFPTGIVYTRP